MILGVDAINVKSGGGLTYLKELIFHLNKKRIDKIVIFVNSKISFNIKNKKIFFVKKKYLNKIFFWQIFGNFFICPMN